MTDSVAFKANQNTVTFARQNKIQMNDSEVRMWLILKKSEYSFRRQQTIGNYIVDFCSLKRKIIIEVDGDSHNEKQEYDLKRINFLISKGFKILIFQQIIPFPNELVFKFVWDEIVKLENGNESVGVFT